MVNRKINEQKSFENREMEVSSPSSNILGKQQKLILSIIVFVNFLRVLGGTAISMGLPGFILILQGEITIYGLILAVYTFTQTIFQTPIAFLSGIELAEKRC